MSDSSAGQLTRRYFLALGLVAVLVVLDQVLVQPPLVQLATDPPVINIAGRQRMLSQRLAKAALALTRGEDDSDQRRHLAELDEVLRRWTIAHNALRQGDRAMSLPGRNSAAVRGSFDEVEPDFTRMRDAARRLIGEYAGDRPDPSAVQDALGTILELEGPYLARMDRIVGLFESETRARVDRLLWTGWAVTVLILVTLVVIGLGVLRPAARLIRRQILELGAARDRLEDRVRERTRELEAANQERALAEERHRRLLEQFSHVARTTTIGEMAGALAHELSQPLGAIANYAEGCLAALDAPSPAVDEIKAALAKLVATTMRTGEIIKRTRRFVTRHEPGNEPFEPNRLVEEVEALLRDESRRRGIGLDMQLALELQNLWGDPVQVQQVLVNLVRNAFDALGGLESVEPKVVIETRRADSSAVEFRVSDNGEGIPRERFERIFDAYFSTRAGGMGMGLAISRTIVEAHQGRISVESEPGVGTTFRFTLPAAGAGSDDEPRSPGLHCGR